MLWLLLGLPALILIVCVVAATLGAGRCEVPQPPSHARGVTRLQPAHEGKTISHIYG